MRHTLLFTGDIMLDRLVKIKNKRANDPLHSFLLIASTTQAADLTIGNLEGPVTDRGVLSGSIYSFRFDPTDTVSSLNFAGFDIVSSANNHILDYGRIGMLDTVKNLREGGIDVALDEPVIKIVGDSKIVFLSFTNLYKGWFDLSTVSSQIAELKSSGKSDIVVVLFHGGTEYETHSNIEQREIAHALVDAGADLFIGTHPHVAQEVEKYKNTVPDGRQGWIAYSLGNFIFDQNFSEETMRGLMVEATIEGKKVVDFKEIPIKLSPTFQPYIVSLSSL